MGMNRTRGYGEVILSLTEKVKENPKNNLNINLEDEIDGEIKLLFKAESNLMIARCEAEISEKYIPGSNILGNVARRYIQDKNIDNFYEMSSEYVDLFLNGNVKYHNCYISNKDEVCYLPMPMSYTKVKNTSNQFYNKIKEVEELNDKNVQLVNIGNKYVTYDDNNYIKDVNLSFSYHHQRPKDKRFGSAKEGEDGGTLYQYLSIEKGQYFLGKITGKVKYLKKIQNYLKEGDTFRVGKSKTAEYGELKLLKVNFAKIDETKKNYHDFAVVLSSNAIILDKTGKVTIDKNDFINKMKEILGSNIVANRSFIEYEKVAGYNIIWNLPKEQVESFKAGSIFSFTCDEGINLKDEYTIGQRTNEGYGTLHIIDISKYENNRQLVLNTYLEVKETKNINDLNPGVIAILKEAIKNNLRDEIIYDVIEKTPKVKLNNSTIGRLMLMLKQANNFQEFLINADSIKDIKKNRNVKMLFREIENKVNNLTAINDLKDLGKINDDLLDKYYLDYVKQILIQKKIEGVK